MHSVTRKSVFLLWLYRYHYYCVVPPLSPGPGAEARLKLSVKVRRSKRPPLLVDAGAPSVDCFVYSEIDWIEADWSNKSRSKWVLKYTLTLCHNRHERLFSFVELTSRVFHTNLCHWLFENVSLLFYEKKINLGSLFLLTNASEFGISYYIIHYSMINYANEYANVYRSL